MNQMVVYGGLGLMAVLAAIPSLGNAQGVMGDFQDMRASASQGASDHARQMLEQENLAARAEIAEQRYHNGCVPVVDWSQQNWVSLIAGEVVIDPVTKFPVPDGTVVCDANGNTAITRNNDKGWPVATSFAFTGNQEVVRRRLSQFQQHNFQQPTNGRRFNTP